MVSGEQRNPGVYWAGGGNTYPTQAAADPLPGNAA